MLLYRVYGIDTPLTCDLVYQARPFLTLQKTLEDEQDFIQDFELGGGKREDFEWGGEEGERWSGLVRLDRLTYLYQICTCAIQTTHYSLIMSNQDKTGCHGYHGQRQL